jgi:hypothetical protein
MLEDLASHDLSVREPEGGDCQLHPALISNLPFNELDISHGGLFHFFSLDSISDRYPL